jgi:demethylmenaquinone methyltransferase/2-methoxy-6-polyprenyl-1,4-benzoquinol methylase
MKEISKTPEKISGMFNEIAADYDKNNNIISLGFHSFIKQIAVKELAPKYNDTVLDLCCGTGDICEILKKYVNPKNIIGIDFSSEMLCIARQKHPSLNFIQSDISSLPQEISNIDKITICFGLRNVEDRAKVLEQVYRVLKPGGFVLHLDFGRKNLFSKMFDLFVSLFVKVMHKNSTPYSYLINSKNQYPEPDDLAKEFEFANLKFFKRKDFVFGVISMQIYKKI